MASLASLYRCSFKDDMSRPRKLRFSLNILCILHNSQVKEIVEMFRLKLYDDCPCHLKPSFSVSWLSLGSTDQPMT